MRMKLKYLSAVTATVVATNGGIATATSPHTASGQGNQKPVPALPAETLSARLETSGS